MSNGSEHGKGGQAVDCEGTIARDWGQKAQCLASTTFTHQRQLFLPINDNYNLDELPLD